MGYSGWADREMAGWKLLVGCCSGLQWVADWEMAGWKLLVGTAVLQYVSVVVLDPE